MSTPKPDEKTTPASAGSDGSAEQTLETAIKCIEARIEMNATIEQREAELKNYSAAETARTRRLAYQNALNLLR